MWKWTGNFTTPSEFGGETPHNEPRPVERPTTEATVKTAQETLTESPEENRRNKIKEVYKRFFAFHRTVEGLWVDDTWLENMSDHFIAEMEHDGFDFVKDSQESFWEDVIKWVWDWFRQDMKRYLNSKDKKLIELDAEATKRLGKQILTNLDRVWIHIKKK